eukprot:11193989-Lingulodinium_polyedra.AAC.1
MSTKAGPSSAPTSATIGCCSWMASWLRRGPRGSLRTAPARAWHGSSAAPSAGRTQLPLGLAHTPGARANSLWQAQ